jgi:hypothetical protein
LFNRLSVWIDGLTTGNDLFRSPPIPHYSAKTQTGAAKSKGAPTLCIVRRFTPKIPSKPGNKRNRRNRELNAHIQITSLEGRSVPDKTYPKRLPAHSKRIVAVMWRIGTLAKRGRFSGT